MRRLEMTIGVMRVDRWVQWMASLKDGRRGDDWGRQMDEK